MKRKKILMGMCAMTMMLCGCQSSASTFEVSTGEDTADGEIHGQRAVVGDEDTEFQMPAGEYMIEFVAYKGATGTLTICVE